MTGRSLIILVLVPFALQAQTHSTNDVAAVNTQINVMSYGAKGDCVTDDSTAITAAQRAALTYAVGNLTPAVLYFPKPPGGCYLTSTIQWQGVPIEGQPSGMFSQQGGVVIKGKPGQDILYAADPSVVKRSFYGDWSIQDVVLEVDDTLPTAGLFPHRWPGRWFDDASMSSGKTQLRSTRAQMSCGDVGSAVQVNGAGRGGTNLITTIQSVQPCWTKSDGVGNSWQLVTLATAASTTVSRAHAYISVGNLPVTANVGNAAIALDDKDGNAADWISGTSCGTIYNKIDNVTFTSVSYANDGQNGSAAIYTQGCWGMYGSRVTNVNIIRTYYGVVEGCSELNSYYQSCANDYQQWSRLQMNASYPWISYNGLHNHFEDIQLATASGFLFLELANRHGDETDDMQFSNSGWEAGVAGFPGWRVNGRGHILNNVTLSNASGQIGYIDSIQTICSQCDGLIALNGYNNKIIHAGDITAGNAVANGGMGNTVQASFASNPIDGFPPAIYSPIPYKGSIQLAGRVTPDFVEDGNSVPYVRDDLFIWPKDIYFNGYGEPGAYGANYQDDPSSPTGGYFNFTHNIGFGHFRQFEYTGPKTGGIVVGTNVPAGYVTLFFSAKCRLGNSFAFSVYVSPSNSAIATQTFSCSTAYQQYSMRANLASHSGDTIYFENTSTTVPSVTWLYLRPDIADINGSPVSSFAQLKQLPQSGTPADNVSCTPGQLWSDANYIYACTASGTVKRVALTAF